MGVRARAHACVFRVCFVFASEAVSGGWKVCGKVSARRSCGSPCGSAVWRRVNGQSSDSSV